MSLLQMLGVPEGDQGLLGDPRAYAAAQGLSGFSNAMGMLASAFAPTTDPGHRARTLGMVGPAMQQGMQTARQGALADGLAQRQTSWLKQVQGLPAEQRNAYLAMGPERGAQMLLETQRRDRALAEFDRLSGGGGSSPSPVSPSGFPQVSVPGGGGGGGGGTPPAVPENLAPIIQRASQESGVPVPVLTAVLQQESRMGQDPGAVANGGGPMQVIRSTAANPGFGLEPLADADRLNPERSIPWGARYLAARARSLGVTDWNDPAQRDRALAAYNGGGDPNYVRNVGRFLPSGASGGSADGMATPVQAQMPQQGAAPRPMVPAAPQGGNDEVDRLRRLSRLAIANPELAPLVQTEIALFQRTNPEWVTERFDDGVFMVNRRNPMQRIRMGALPEGAPLSPERFTQERTLREAGRTNVTQNAEVRGENAEAAGRGRLLAEEEATVRTEAAGAANTVDAMRQVRALNTPTGRLAPAREAVGGWLEAMGMGPQSRLVREAQTIQAFNAAASSAVLSAQLQQKGVATEGDAQRISQTWAQLRNTPEANDFIMRAAEAQATRLMERDEFYQQWRQQGGENGRPRNSVDGAGAAWRRFIRETPLVAQTQGGAVFLNEWLPAALQRPEINGDRDAALRLWRENARAR